MVKRGRTGAIFKYRGLNQVALVGEMQAVKVHTTGSGVPAVEATLLIPHAERTDRDCLVPLYHVGRDAHAWMELEGRLVQLAGALDCRPAIGFQVVVSAIAPIDNVVVCQPDEGGAA